MPENRRKTGTEYEERAADYLASHGCRILARSFRCHIGEIDIIAEDPAEGCIVFVEVKYRKSGNAGGPFAAVGFRKQQTISRVANFYLHRYGYPLDTVCRFDVIGITPDGLEHIKNAFQYIG